MKSLQSKINDAEGYLAVTPEYNVSTSGAMKNTLDYFLEEYFSSHQLLSLILQEGLVG
jgi:NAD(P)H-dependent FMN reductase